MKSAWRWILVIVVVGLVGVLSYAWIANMEKRVVSVPDFKTNTSFQTAEKFLKARGWNFRRTSRLEIVLEKAAPNATLLITSGLHKTPISEQKKLLAWLQNGGTLLLQTSYCTDSLEWLRSDLNLQEQCDFENDTEDKEELDNDADESVSDGMNGSDEVENDLVVDTACQTMPKDSSGLPPVYPAASDSQALADLLDTIQKQHTNHTSSNDEDQNSDESEYQDPDSVSWAKLPHNPRLLRIDVRDARWIHLLHPSRDDWRDSVGPHYLMRRVNKGHLVLGSDFEIFSNRRIRHYDHAELLEGLSSWNGQSKEFWLTENVDMPPWYTWLWEHASAVWIGLLLFLGALAWRVTKRFTPITPLPETDPRELRAHLDASGNWLWTCADGPEFLLERLQLATLRDLTLRHPELARKPRSSQVQILSELYPTMASRLPAALIQQGKRTPQEFTNAVQTLQELQKVPKS